MVKEGNGGVVNNASLESPWSWVLTKGYLDKKTFIWENTSTATFGVQFTIRILRLLQGLNLNSTAPVCVRRWITFPRLNKGYKNLTFVPPTSRLRWHREMPRRTAEVCVLSDARCKFTLLSCVTGFFYFILFFYRLEMWLCRNVTASTSS